MTDEHRDGYIRRLVCLLWGGSCFAVDRKATFKPEKGYKVINPLVKIETAQWEDLSVAILMFSRSDLASEQQMISSV